MRRQDVGLDAVQAPVGVGQADNAIVPREEQEGPAGVQADESEDDWDLGYARRQDVGLAGVQEPVAVA